MRMSMMSSLILLVMSSHMAFEGIIPVLLLKILLLKGRLLLGPPIALGAFVIGHGSGLLIGKLLGIDYLLDRWYGKRQRHKPHGWKPHGRPKRPKLLHRLRWVLKGLFHRGWKEGRPPMFSHPPEYYIKHYEFNHPTLGVKHAYHGPHGPPVEYETKSHDYHGPPPDLLHSYSEQPHKQYSTLNDWQSTGPGGYKSFIPGKPPPSYDDDYDHAESQQYHQGGHNNNRNPDLPTNLNQFSYSNDEEENHPAQSDSKNIFSILNQKESQNPSATDFAKLAEQLIIEEFLRPKQISDNKITEEDKNKLLAKLLERQFALELLESSPDKSKVNRATPKFVPFPEDTAELINNATTTPQTIESSKPKSKKAKRKDSSTVLTPLWNMFSKFDPTDLVPQSVLKWMFEPGSQEDSTENDDDKDSSKSRRKREVAGSSKLSEEEQITELTNSFLKDVQNLFSIVSFLDINQCLEKMVCDVHTKVNDPKITSYESNLVSAFKVMDAIMPSSDSKSVSEDSSTKYRRAARLGEITRSSESCRRAFSTCSMESNNIVSLGNIASLGAENASEEDSEKL